MIVNIGTKIAPVNIAFSISTNASLIERYALRNIIYKTPSLYPERIKTQVFSLSDVPACVSIHCADQKQHSNTQKNFLTKSIDKTLQTCVDIANEYLRAYNTGADLKNQLCRSLHQNKQAFYTMFLFAFVLSF